MSQVRVESLESIKAMKVALIKFIETANAAMGDAESDASRTLNWLEHDQTSYWNSQARKRHEFVEKCKEAVRMKKLYKDSSGKPQSAAEEEKALRQAQAKLEEALQKQINVKRAIPRLQKEMQMYQGTVQRFATTVQVDLREAGHKLEDLLRHLDAYIGLRPNEVTSSSDSATSAASVVAGDDLASIARPEPVKPDDHTPKSNTTEPSNGTS